MMNGGTKENSSIRLVLFAFRLYALLFLYNRMEKEAGRCIRFPFHNILKVLSQYQERQLQSTHKYTNSSLPLCESLVIVFICILQIKYKTQKHLLPLDQKKE